MVHPATTSGRLYILEANDDDGTERESDEDDDGVEQPPHKRVESASSKTNYVYQIN
jgi:hypothetical protein